MLPTKDKGNVGGGDRDPVTGDITTVTQVVKESKDEELVRSITIPRDEFPKNISITPLSSIHYPPLGSRLIDLSDEKLKQIRVTDFSFHGPAETKSVGLESIGKIIFEKVQAEIDTGTIAKNYESANYSVYSKLRGNFGSSLIFKIDGKKYTVGNLSSFGTFYPESGFLGFRLDFSTTAKSTPLGQEIISFMFQKNEETGEMKYNIAIRDQVKTQESPLSETTYYIANGEDGKHFDVSKLESDSKLLSYEYKYDDNLRNWGLGLFTASVATSLGLLSVFNKNKADKSN